MGTHLWLQNQLSFIPFESCVCVLTSLVYKSNQMSDVLCVKASDSKGIMGSTRLEQMRHSVPLPDIQSLLSSYANVLWIIS